MVGLPVFVYAVWLSSGNRVDGDMPFWGSVACVSWVLPIVLVAMIDVWYYRYRR